MLFVIITFLQICISRLCMVLLVLIDLY